MGVACCRTYGINSCVNHICHLRCGLVVVSHEDFSLTFLGGVDLGIVSSHLDPFFLKCHTMVSWNCQTSYHCYRLDKTEFLPTFLLPNCCQICLVDCLPRFKACKFIDMKRIVNLRYVNCFSRQLQFAASKAATNLVPPQDYIPVAVLLRLTVFDKP